MDSDLRAQLTAIRDETAAVRVVAEAARQSADAARQLADTALKRADTGLTLIEEVRREARVMHEATMQAIRTVAEGLVGLREHIDRRFDAYHADLMHRHVGPLEAAARSTAAHLTDHEQRIGALERRNSPTG